MCRRDLSSLDSVGKHPSFPSILWEDIPFWVLLALQSASELHLSTFGSFGLSGFPLTSKALWPPGTPMHPSLLCFKASLHPCTVFSCHKLKFKKSRVRDRSREWRTLSQGSSYSPSWISLCCSLLLFQLQLGFVFRSFKWVQQVWESLRSFTPSTMESRPKSPTSAWLTGWGGPLLAVEHIPALFVESHPR